VQGEAFDQVLLATGASDAARLLEHSEAGLSAQQAQCLKGWRSTAQALQFEAITTVYAYAPTARLAQPMLALRSDAQNPAQFAFDRGQLDGPAGLMALVVSASTGERDSIERQVLAQARNQLGLELKALRSISEKRATFACTAGLKRPPMEIAPGLRACGDYIDGPYPATLEGAVRSGLQAVCSLPHTPLISP
jgi:predicted NAD/FAD-dependent oxidoreductase